MKRLLSLILLCAASAYGQASELGTAKVAGTAMVTATATGEVQLDSDTFGGTAATALPSYNANWVLTNMNGTFNNLNISTPNGGVASSSGPGGNYRTGFTWTNNQWAGITVGAVPAQTFEEVCVRITAGSGNQPDMYCAGNDAAAQGNGKYEISIWTNGARTQLVVTASQTMTAGDVVNFNAVGTTLTLKVNGTQILQTTDSTWTTGNPGLIINGSTTTANYANTWLAGSN